VRSHFSLTSTLCICWRNYRKLHCSRDYVGIIFGCAIETTAFVKTAICLFGTAEPNEPRVKQTFHPKCGSVPNRASNRWVCAAPDKTIPGETVGKAGTASPSVNRDLTHWRSCLASVFWTVLQLVGVALVVSVYVRKDTPRYTASLASCLPDLPNAGAIAALRAQEAGISQKRSYRPNPCR
jgi:hypothetical protein